MKKLTILLLCCALADSVWAQDVELVLSSVFPNEESKIENDYLVHPFDLKIYKGFYYICDAVECCVKIFSASGELIRKIGKKGQGPGELGSIFKLAVDEEDGLIYCADSGNSRIDIFDSSGNYRGGIKTLIPPKNVICVKGRIITASYNRTFNSFYTMYDSQHRITKTFGNLFDTNVPNTAYTPDVYAMVDFAKDGGLLYIMFEYLPFVSIYSIDGQLVNRVTIDNKEVKKMYDGNILALKRGPIDGVLGVAPWNRGGCLHNNSFYYLGDPNTEEVWAFDMRGKLLQKIPFKDKENKLYHRLVTVDNGKFVFLDVHSGQVKLYEVVHKGG